MPQICLVFQDKNEYVTDASYVFTARLHMNNVLLHESRAEIPQRSLGETLSVSCILSLEIYAHSSTVAIIKQLQFHMAASFEIEEEKGGGKSSIFKKE